MVLLAIEETCDVPALMPVLAAGVWLGVFGSSRLTCVSLAKEGDDLASGLSAAAALAGSCRESTTDGAEAQPVNNNASGRARNRSLWINTQT